MRLLHCCTLLCLSLALIACRSAAPSTTPAPSPTPTAAATAQIGSNFVTKAPPKQTVLQITPSPLPSATPTATPTPIVYVVNDGDTFWSIAFNNRTTPDDLQALNPATNPDFISIGDQLILPPPATPIYQTTLGTPVPLAIQVTAANLFRTPSGAAWVMGEVENQGAVAAADVKIGITLQDKAQTAVFQTDAWVSAAVIAPTEKAPFAALIPELADQEYDLVVSVVDGNSVRNLGSRYLDLSIAESAMQIAEQGVQLSGIISNSGAISATVSIVATVLDDSGKVIGLSQFDYPRLIAGEDSAEFSLSLSTLTDNIADYRLLAIGHRDQTEINR